MTITGGWNDGTSQVNAQKLRWAQLGALAGSGGAFAVTGGVRMTTSNALQVASSGAGLGVTVQPGMCVIPGTDVSAQGAYWLVSDAVVNLTLDAAHGSLPRYDRVIALADDNGDNTSSYTITKVTGTAAGAPSLPAMPPSSLALGHVLVPANAVTPGALTFYDDRVPVEMLGRPQQPVPFIPHPSIATPPNPQTDSSFVPVELSKWLVQQPRLYAYVSAKCSDGFTAGEVRIVVGGVALGSVQAATLGFNGFLTFGPTAHGATVGTLADVTLEVRRTSGTGTIAARIVAAYGYPT